MYSPNSYSSSSSPPEIQAPSGRLARFSRLALEEAMRSDMPVRHGAVLVRGGKALARGCNHSRNRLLGKDLCSVHAEVAHGCDLFVVRAAVPGVPECERRGRRAAAAATAAAGGGEEPEPVYKNSRPCAECVLVLRNHGVARVFFSTGSGPSLAVMRLRPGDGEEADAAAAALRPGFSGGSRGAAPPAFRGDCFAGAKGRRRRKGAPAPPAPYEPRDWEPE
eukprot:tig00000147_g9488.t1